MTLPINFFLATLVLLYCYTLTQTAAPETRKTCLDCSSNRCLVHIPACGTAQLWDDALRFLKILQTNDREAVDELGLKCLREDHCLSSSAFEIFHGAGIIDENGNIKAKLRALLRVCFDYQGNTAKLKEYLLNEEDDTLIYDNKIRKKSSSNLFN